MKYYLKGEVQPTNDLQVGRVYEARISPQDSSFQAIQELIKLKPFDDTTAPHKTEYISNSVNVMIREDGDDFDTILFKSEIFHARKYGRVLIKSPIHVKMVEVGTGTEHFRTVEGDYQVFDISDLGVGYYVIRV